MFGHKQVIDDRPIYPIGFLGVLLVRTDAVQLFDSASLKFSKLKNYQFPISKKKIQNHRTDGSS